MTSTLNNYNALAQVRNWRKWEAMLKAHWASETWITALMGVFVGLTLLLALLPKSPVYILISTMWLVVLLATTLALPMLIIHCTKEWRVFKCIISLDPDASKHRWASGNIGKAMTFLHLRRVPSDPIRDGIVGFSAFVQETLRNAKNGR